MCVHVCVCARARDLVSTGASVYVPVRAYMRAYMRTCIKAIFVFHLIRTEPGQEIKQK